ncbi:zeta toxin family protein [Lentilactobacillus diolivorans]|uniref:UDP-N-acetylglucosamine kinase n=2 Tax=Lentilactobacillus diolivorans TaxID=179838 RepID=A0A0R1S2S6_9LACO|nr:AAA family ATPase [Lentilactobacillus diolivorans]KRL62846.1 hypothetical protein FC85_GL001713 [Lentilactobacillus diolivorans DSM 14421]GEP23433.1 hypothetical protein LDI01_10260 [Lentilactobacillus diolivorans]
MVPILILIRGNSASGKTVLAKKLQAHFGYQNCLLLQQDVLRRNLLHANDHPGTPAISLIESLVTWGQNHYPIIILEGILRKDVYGQMLEQISQQFGHHAFIYYLNISFEQTLKHNAKKPQPFSSKLLEKWWLPNDYLSPDDRLLVNGNTDIFLKKIISDINDL